MPSSQISSLLSGALTFFSHGGKAFYQLLELKSIRGSFMALDLAMILGIGFGNDNKSTGKKEKLDKLNFIKI